MMVKDLVNDLEKGNRTVEHLKKKEVEPVPQVAFPWQYSPGGMMQWNGSSDYIQQAQAQYTTAMNNTMIAATGALSNALLGGLR